jgi:hypothetical protein
VGLMPNAYPLVGNMEVDQILLEMAELL